MDYRVSSSWICLVLWIKYLWHDRPGFLIITICLFAVSFSETSLLFSSGWVSSCSMESLLSFLTGYSAHKNSLIFLDLAWLAWICSIRFSLFSTLYFYRVFLELMRFLEWGHSSNKIKVSHFLNYATFTMFNHGSLVFGA